MELDIYLEELRSCPDGSASRDWNNSEFFKRFGVYNNFLILTSFSPEKITEILLSEDKFSKIIDYSDTSIGLLYRPGSVKAQIELLQWSDFKGRPVSFCCSDDAEHALLQKEKFITRLTLFVSSPKIQGIIDDMKAMAVAIEDIALLAKKYKFALCLPKSGRYPNYTDFPKEDVDRIVYYFPE